MTRIECVGSESQQCGRLHFVYARREEFIELLFSVLSVQAGFKVEVVRDIVLKKTLALI